MACKRSPVRSRYSPPSAQMRVPDTVDFKSKSTVFLCLSASKFITILQILCKIKVEVHMDLVSAINFYPADKLADDHLLCFKAGTIVQVCVRDQFFVQLRYVCHQFSVSLQFCTGFFTQSFQLRVLFSCAAIISARVSLGKALSPLITARISAFKASRSFSALSRSA